MSRTEVSRGHWLPSVSSDGGRFLLEIIGGADALGDARKFTVSVSEEHVARIRDDLPRHVLVRAALLPLCYAAGSLNHLDESAAVRLLDTILHGNEHEVDAAFENISWDSRCALISHGADPALLDAGKVFAASQSATSAGSWDRVRKYVESRQGPRAAP
ncbi:DUF6357 family protein [uncultured Agrococcus sp.]|uniref:DUF6357 family protein n=1 Tax=uncultured Agrococcus sp. TaxID=382258 RepID=UPI0025F9E1DA|nr:DUF6357 family protein [uncultured Agrococcus sp.]